MGAERRAIWHRRSPDRLGCRYPVGKAVAQYVSLQLRVIDPPPISDIVMRCASDEFEIRDREGRTGRGFTNLKRFLGRPADFAFVVDQLARTIPAGHAVAACDEGAWALGGAIALKLGVPAVLVRRAPKTYFVSYGDDPTVGDGRLVGERLPYGTPIHLIDDLVFAGQTLRSAREALSLVGLDGKTASAILWTYRADAAKDELAAAGMTEITCLTHQNLMPG
jgi:adenine/guanine phosphoribosyltransferase-like PRPP-binding protein